MSFGEVGSELDDIFAQEGDSDQDMGVTQPALATGAAEGAALGRSEDKELDDIFDGDGSSPFVGDEPEAQPASRASPSLGGDLPPPSLGAAPSRPPRPDARRPLPSDASAPRSQSGSRRLSLSGGSQMDPDAASVGSGSRLSAVTGPSAAGDESVLRKALQAAPLPSLGESAGAADDGAPLSSPLPAAGPGYATSVRREASGMAPDAAMVAAACGSGAARRALPPSLRLRVWSLVLAASGALRAKDEHTTGAAPDGALRLHGASNWSAGRGAGGGPGEGEGSAASAADALADADASAADAVADATASVALGTDDAATLAVLAQAAAALRVDPSSPGLAAAAAVVAAAAAAASPDEEVASPHDAASLGAIAAALAQSISPSAVAQRSWPHVPAQRPPAGQSARVAAPAAAVEARPGAEPASGAGEAWPSCGSAAESVGIEAWWRALEDEAADAGWKRHDDESTLGAVPGADDDAAAVAGGLGGASDSPVHAKAPAAERSVVRASAERLCDALLKGRDEGALRRRRESLMRFRVRSAGEREDALVLALTAYHDPALAAHLTSVRPGWHRSAARGGCVPAAWLGSGMAGVGGAQGEALLSLWDRHVMAMTDAPQLAWARVLGGQRGEAAQAWVAQASAPDTPAAADEAAEAADPALTAGAAAAAAAAGARDRPASTLAPDAAKEGAGSAGVTSPSGLEHAAFESDEDEDDVDLWAAAVGPAAGAAPSDVQAGGFAAGAGKDGAAASRDARSTAPVPGAAARTPLAAPPVPPRGLPRVRPPLSAALLPAALVVAVLRGCRATLLSTAPEKRPEPAAAKAGGSTSGSTSGSAGRGMDFVTAMLRGAARTATRETLPETDDAALPPPDADSAAGSGADAANTSQRLWASAVAIAEASPATAAMEALVAWAENAGVPVAALGVGFEAEAAVDGRREAEAAAAGLQRRAAAAAGSSTAARFRALTGGSRRPASNAAAATGTGNDDRGNSGSGGGGGAGAVTPWSGDGAGGSRPPLAGGGIVSVGGSSADVASADALVLAAAVDAALPVGGLTVGGWAARYPDAMGVMAERLGAWLAGRTAAEGAWLLSADRADWTSLRRDVATSLVTSAEAPGVLTSSSSSSSSSAAAAAASATPVGGAPAEAGASAAAARRASAPAPPPVPRDSFGCVLLRADEAALALSSGSSRGRARLGLRGEARVRSVRGSARWIVVDVRPESFRKLGRFGAAFHLDTATLPATAEEALEMGRRLAGGADADGAAGSSSEVGATHRATESSADGSPRRRTDSELARTVAQAQLVRGMSLAAALGALAPVRGVAHIAVMGVGAEALWGFYPADKLGPAADRDRARVRSAVAALQGAGFPMVSAVDGGYAAVLRRVRRAGAVSRVADFDRARCPVCRHAMVAAHARRRRAEAVAASCVRLAAGPSTAELAKEAGDRATAAVASGATLLAGRISQGAASLGERLRRAVAVPPSPTLPPTQVASAPAAGPLPGPAPAVPAPAAGDAPAATSMWSGLAGRAKSLGGRLSSQAAPASAGVASAGRRAAAGMRGLFSRVAQAVEGTGPDAPAPADAGGASERQGGVPSGSTSARRAEQRQDSGDARFAIDDEEEEEEEDEAAAEDGKGEARAGSAADGSSAGDAAPAAAPAAAPGFGPTAPGPLSPLGHRILAALAPGEPQTSSGIHKALEGHGGAAGVAVFGGGSGSARTVVLLSRQRLVVGASEPDSPDSFVVTRNLHVTELVKLRFGKEGQSLRLTLRGQSPDDGLVVQVSDRRGMVAALRDTLLGHR